MGGGALERGDGAALERLAQLGDAQGGVGTVGTAMHIVVDAAELVPVAIQAAKGRRGVSMGADTKANNGSGALKIRDLRLLEDGSECGGALVSDVVAVETAKHGRGPGGERPGMSMGADTKANPRELVREVGGLLERLQRRVALETLCKRGSSCGTELVALETAGVGLRGGW